MIYIPELPEVETLRRGLSHYLVGHKVEDVEVRLPKILSGDPKDITHAKIVDVRRFGKGLVIDFDNGYSLAIHIKLTGQLIYQGLDIPKGTEVSREKVGTIPNKFTHIIFKLQAPNPKSQEAYLYYNDLRRFGWLKIVQTGKVKELPFFKDLGPEFPLIKGDNNITIEQFNNLLSRSKGPIKPLLMDQKKMSGVGNIYANDALYLAKIDPRRPAKSLSAAEAKTLFEAILTVLKKGLQEGGASELTFVNVLGQMGNYQNHSLIYAHQGKKCKRDGTVIIKFMLGGRSTYMCPTCQK